MRVLFLAGQLIGGGAERQLAVLLRFARARGLKPSCFVLNAGGPWEEPVRAECEVFRTGRRSHLLRMLDLLRSIRESRAQVVHCWNAYVAPYAVVTRPLHRRPVLVNLRADLTRDAETGRPSTPGFVRWVSRCDGVVSNSAHNLRALEREKILAARSWVVPNGLEVPAREPGLAAGNGIRVVGVGSLKALKNWAQMIRVCGRLRGDGHEIRPTIYGEGEEREALEALCREHGFDPAETLPGYVEDLPKRLAGADILLHCSKSEGLPNAVLEGLANGLPVVASDLPICRDLGESGEFLRTFPVEDDERCRIELARLVADPGLRVELGRRARDFVRENFDREAMAERHMEIYRAVSSGSS